MCFKDPNRMSLPSPPPDCIGCYALTVGARHKSHWRQWESSPVLHLVTGIFKCVVQSKGEKKKENKTTEQTTPQKQTKEPTNKTSSPLKPFCKSYASEPNRTSPGPCLFLHLPNPSQGSSGQTLPCTHHSGRQLSADINPCTTIKTFYTRSVVAPG